MKRDHDVYIHSFVNLIYPDHSFLKKI